jgi:hypothetical protein
MSTHVPDPGQTEARAAARQSPASQSPHGWLRRCVITLLIISGIVTEKGL